MVGSITTVGFAITALNASILVVLIINIYKSYKCAADIETSKRREDVDFYFMQLITSMIFFVANAIALYTGILTYIIKPWSSLDAIVYWRLADRTGMLAVSVTMMWNRMKHNPFR